MRIRVESLSSRRMPLAYLDNGNAIAPWNNRAVVTHLGHLWDIFGTFEKILWHFGEDS